MRPDDLVFNDQVDNRAFQMREFTDLAGGDSEYRLIGDAPLNQAGDNLLKHREN
jgi:hypothetical protein